MKIFRKYLPILIVLALFANFTAEVWGGATFSRVKVWNSGETLTAADLNAEFDNLLTNLTPTGVDDTSSTTAAMQAVADPYPAGVLSQPTSLQGEIQRLRYMIKALSGQSYWYIHPPSSLAIISGNGANIASAATVDLSTATGGFIHITGNTGPITSFGTVAAGGEYTLVFDSTPTITYNATSMILPSAADIVAEAGDVMRVKSEGAGNWKVISYQRASGKPILDNSLNQQTIYNLSFTATVSGKALTVALKDINGNNPSAASPARVGFRSSTLTTGTPVIRSITGVLSVSLSSGSTLGFTAAQAGRIYVWAIDNAGTVELALSRRADTFPEVSLVSTTAEGGAGGADSATVMYSTTSRSNVICRCIGYIEITTGATAGEWDNAPTKIQVMGPGVKRTGDVVQKVYAVKTDTFGGGYGSFTDVTGLAVSMAPRSTINRVFVRSSFVGGGTTNYTCFARLVRDSTVLLQGDVNGSATRTGIAWTTILTDGGYVPVSLEAVDVPGTVSSVSYHVEIMVRSGGEVWVNRAQTSGNDPAYALGAAIITAEEIME